MSNARSLNLGDIHLTAGSPEAAGRPTEEVPFRILLLGSFSGRQTGAPLAGRRPVLIDRDNLDEVLARLDVQARLPLGRDGPTPLTVRFKELDDFHPDRLFASLETFAALRNLRRRLESPRTFAEAAAEVRGWTSAPAPAAAPPPAPAAPPPSDPAALLEHILGGESAPAPTPAGPPAAVDWNAYLRRVVAPYLVPGTDPDAEELVARVDAATADQMRAVLHHPAFQAVESAWRALHLLTRRLDTDEGLKLYLLDVTKEELAADLAGAAELRGSGTFKLLVEQTVGTPGAAPWALLAGNYTFGPTPEDALLLARLGAVARAAGAPFLAGADTRLFGCASPAATPDPDDWGAPPGGEAGEVWAALRGTPQAASLGLAAPRFLLRQPYGKGSNPVEAFALEELPGGKPHEGYLWGNAAFACALLLGEAFNRAGWGLRPGMFLEIDSLPAHIYSEDGESRLKPCAEAILTERAAERILDAGVMPLLSVRDRDKVRLGRFQSLAAPAAPLAGRWQ
jgi:type VI secretion system protein ImpC